MARVECATPALLTRMVTVPSAFSAWSKARFMAARSSTSASTAMALPPSLLDFLNSSFQLVGAARHQRHRRAVFRQHLGKAQPGRRTRRTSAAAFEVEQF